MATISHQKIKVEGFDEAMKKLSAPYLLAGPAGRCLDRIGHVIGGRAKENVNVDRGRLKTSIFHAVDKNAGGNLAAKVGADIPTWVRVGTNVAYAPFVHEGRKPGGKFPPMDVIRAWARRHGIEKAAFLIARKIAKKGIDPNPFLMDAIKESGGDIEKFVGKMGVEIRALWEAQ